MVLVVTQLRLINKKNKFYPDQDFSSVLLQSWCVITTLYDKQRHAEETKSKLQSLDVFLSSTGVLDLI